MKRGRTQEPINLVALLLRFRCLGRYKAVYFRLRMRWRKPPGNCSGLVVYTVESVKNSRFCTVEHLGVIPLDSGAVCSVVNKNELMHLNKPVQMELTFVNLNAILIL